MYICISVYCVLYILYILYTSFYNLYIIKYIKCEICTHVCTCLLFVCVSYVASTCTKTFTKILTETCLRTLSHGHTELRWHRNCRAARSEEASVTVFVSIYCCIVNIHLYTHFIYYIYIYIYIYIHTYI